MAEFDTFPHSYDCNEIKDIQNWTHHKIADEILTFPLAKILLVKAFIPVVFVIGFVGNVAFLVLLARVKTMRTITNFYLANLAVADLIVLSLKALYQLLSYQAVLGDPFHRSLGCGMNTYFGLKSSSASVLFITLVSFDRYFAVCHPVKYRSKKNKKRTSYILTLFIWTIAASIGLLGTLSFGRLVVDYCILWPAHDKYKYFPQVVKKCQPLHPVFENISLKVYLTLFITSVIANSIINIKILQTLTRPVPGENGNEQSQQMKRRITWMLLINSIIFFCSLAPLNYVMLMNILNLSHPNILQGIAFCLAMINSALNPILYGVVSPSYRRGFLKAFCLIKNQIVPIEEQKTDRSVEQINS